MTTKTILIALLLASIAICSSSPIIDCRCLKLAKAVNWRRVVRVIEHDPLPYCRKRQVIVVMKNRKEICVDPGITIPQHLRATRGHTEAHAS